MMTAILCYYNNRVDVCGHKYVFGLTQNHLSPSVAKVKMSSGEGEKHIYAKEHQLYYYCNNFKDDIFEQKLITQKWAFKMIYKLTIT